MRIARLPLLFLTLCLSVAEGAPEDRELWSEKIDGFPVHIYTAPGATKDPSKRGVLVLGTFSDARTAIADARKLINPSTSPPRPYDVIIGLSEFADPAGKPLLQKARAYSDEVAARVLADHFSAEKNAAAVKKGIERRFGSALEAASVDMHSNGTPVGISAMEQGTFKGVRQLHLMGPDVGYAGQYVAEERLDKMKGLGVEEVHVHRTKGDVIHGLGYMTEGIAQASKPVSVRIGELARAAVERVMGLSASGGSPDSIVRPHEYEQATLGEGMFDAHFAKRYVAQRAQRSRDAALIEATRRSMGAEEYDHAVGPRTEPGAAEKGVRIQFDERILADVLTHGTPEETARLLQDLGARLAAAETEDQRAAVLARFEARVTERYRRGRASVELRDLTAVSLKQLVLRAEGASGGALPDEVRHPGPLSRIHGYAAVGDDILILGRIEPGDEPIALDDLIVGVRAAWKENETPLVSLDPDPEDMEGDPRVRVQGVPGDSAFALTMLEADYAMKRIMAGVDPVEVPGYETLRAILDATDRDFISRFWLYPVQPGMGDIEIASDGSSALFLGAVQVLSEEMLLLREGLVGTGKTYGPAERAARSFTAHYEAIASGKPAFRRLEGLFDVVLLSRIWRNTGRASPLLDRLCALAHEPVKVPTTYPAVRVVVRAEGGSEYVLSGGAQAKVGAGRFSWLALERGEFQSLDEGTRALAASGRLAGPIAGPPVPVPVPSTRPDEASLEFAQAVGGLLRGDLDAALAAADRMVGKAPTDAEALMLRAVVHVRRADYGRARRDAERARELDPDSRETDAAAGEILFQCAWMEGDPEAALEALEWNLRRDPDGARAHVARGETLAVLDRPDDARAAFQKALEIDPTSAVACANLAILELTEGRTLDAKPWVRRARALGRDLPEVRMAEASWELVTVRPDKAEALARGVWEDQSASPTVRLQALTVLASVAASRERWSEVDERIAMMGRLAAGSPEVLVVAAEIAFTWGERERGEKYLLEAERLAPGHPLVRKLRASRQR